MRFLSLVFFLCLYHNSQAIEDAILLPIQYTVITDVLDPDIKKNKFILEGHVKMYSSTNPIENCLVGCTSSGIFIRTDGDGYFKIVLESSDSTVYFYLKGWSEVVIENYDFKAQHRIDMDVYLIKDRIGNSTVKRKPVIYLYSEEDKTVDIKLDPLGEFIFTYPEYKDGWTVNIKDDNLFVGGENYPYLFWEGKTDDLNYSFEQNSIEGFVIAKENVVSFLETSLDQIGFNSTEKTDFITYWGPILERDEYALIQFVQDDAYNNEIGKIEMNPKPDSSKRLFIKCSNLKDENLGVEVKKQELTSFERTGLTLVEWGGALIDINDLGH
ncbi:MAG: hypothetical protein ACI857_003404 [Arenicella sp.]|jgi:hypothetical protein